MSKMQGRDMKKQYISVCLGLTAVLLFSACENFESLLKPKETVTVSQKRKIDGPLLAQVNNWRIGLGDFEERLKFLETMAEQQNLDINDYEFKKQVLDELVKTVLLAEEAKSRGLDKERDIIEAIASYEQTLMAQHLLGEIVKSINVTDIEAENFYNQNKAYFKSPEQVKVREIAVNSSSEAKNLYIRILQGEDFSYLAGQLSVLPSKSKKGDLGYISYDSKQKFQRFWEVALILDKGELSSIFRGDDGKYYILRVEDKKEGKTTSLEEIREDIKKMLKVDKENKEIERLTDSIKQKAKVIVNHGLLQ